MIGLLSAGSYLALHRHEGVATPATARVVRADLVACAAIVLAMALERA